MYLPATAQALWALLPILWTMAEGSASWQQDQRAGSKSEASGESFHGTTWRKHLREHRSTLRSPAPAPACPCVFLCVGFSNIMKCHHDISSTSGHPLHDTWPIGRPPKYFSAMHCSPPPAKWLSSFVFAWEAVLQLFE